MSGSKGPLSGSGGGLTPIADERFVGNFSGAPAIPGTVEITAGAGVILTPGVGTLEIAAAGIGLGTVTQVDTGTGLTGGPITTFGTVSLAATNTGFFLGNFSGGSAAPVPVEFLAGSGITLSATTTSLTVTASVGITSIVFGAGLSGGTITTSGSVAVIVPPVPQGRLTLTTAVPVMTATVTGATTVYYTPYIGGYLPLYDGTNFVPTAFTELSQATTDATKSPAAVANNSNYDIFGWTDAGTVRATRGPLWSGDTSRGTGAGTTELVRVGGILLNANNITNGPAAQRGTYLGSVRSNGSATIDMIYGGTGAAGGELTICGVQNAYQGVVTAFVNFDNTDSWNYTTASLRIKNNNNSNKISYICGVPGGAVLAINSSIASNSSINITKLNGIGEDSTTTSSSRCNNGYNATNAANQANGFHAHYAGPMLLGFHYLAPLEYSAATGTCTWNGDGGVPGLINSNFVVTLTA